MFYFHWVVMVWYLLFFDGWLVGWLSNFVFLCFMWCVWWVLQGRILYEFRSVPWESLHCDVGVILLCDGGLLSGSFLFWYLEETLFIGIFADLMEVIIGWNCYSGDILKKLMILYWDVVCFWLWNFITRF